MKEKNAFLHFVYNQVHLVGFGETYIYFLI